MATRNSDGLMEEDGMGWEGLAPSIRERPERLTSEAYRQGREHERAKNADLLAALRLMRDAVKAYGFGPLIPDAEGNAAYEAAGAALAKAEGRS